MRRIAVIGSTGSGKSTLATALAEKTGLPLVHLDPLFWAPGWSPRPRDDAERQFAEALASERWIADGNFLDASPDRFARADAVVFVDHSRWTCFRRVVTRARRREPRADLPDGCTDGIGLELLRDLWGYPRRERPRALELATHVVRSDEDAAQLLAEVEADQPVDPPDG